MHASYSVGALTVGVVQSEHGRLSPPERVSLNAKEEADAIAGEVLSINPR
jgi:hypothetical protein